MHPLILSTSIPPSNASICFLVIPLKLHTSPENQKEQFEGETRHLIQLSCQWSSPLRRRTILKMPRLSLLYTFTILLALGTASECRQLGPSRSELTPVWPPAVKRCIGDGPYCDGLGSMVPGNPLLNHIATCPCGEHLCTANGHCIGCCDDDNFCCGSTEDTLNCCDHRGQICCPHECCDSATTCNSFGFCNWSMVYSSGLLGMWLTTRSQTWGNTDPHRSQNWTLTEDIIWKRRKLWNSNSLQIVHSSAFGREGEEYAGAI